MPNSVVDVLIIGGGVIGLTSAWFLAKKGLKVAVLDKSNPGMGASWAGAGIIPPGNYSKGVTPNDKLRGRGSHIHPLLHQELFEKTGIHNGYRVCGGLEFFFENEGPTQNRIIGWKNEGIEFGQHAPFDQNMFPEWHLTDQVSVITFPRMAQVRNPRHLRALIQVVESEGVQIFPETTISQMESRGDKLNTIQTLAGDTFHPNKVLFATGAWTGLLDPGELGINTKIQPIRGQMVQFDCPESSTWPIIEVGKRYMVPRGDGVLLVGSTEEMAGYDATTTPQGLEGILRFAKDLVPCLGDRLPKKSWAGLRPWSPRGIPFIGPLPGWSNVLINAGHFRWGLQFSPAAAEITTAQITGETLDWINMDTFDPLNPPPFEESILFMS